MCTADWSIRTMDHAMGSDWTLGSVHVTGEYTLVTQEEAVHDKGIIRTCT